MAGSVVKAKLGELEEDIRKVFSSWLRNELTGVVVRMVGKKRHLVSFEDGFEKEPSSNQLTVMKE